jgi:hypothetical protein
MCTIQQLKSVLSFPKRERKKERKKETSPKILAAFYETNLRAKYSL